MGRGAQPTEPDGGTPGRTTRKSQAARLSGLSTGQHNAIMKTLLLFVATALAEIIGCYLPYLWLKQGRSMWLLVPGFLSLALFAWLLTLHDTAAGRVYAAYGGVYISVALLWLWAVDQVRPTVWDIAGVAMALIGMGIIMFQPAR
jgi:small multidrug resistance family-3 protein